jgi:hypothetical protein
VALGMLIVARVELWRVTSNAWSTPGSWSDVGVGFTIVVRVPTTRPRVASPT